LQDNVFDERFAAKPAFYKNNGWRFIFASFIQDSAVILSGVFWAHLSMPAGEGLEA
jgi:hypothetical protein